jgi:dolichyl-phosphate-mannose-protein mannosyltransferase
VNANGTVRASARDAALIWGLPALLLVGLVVRLLYIGNEGFKTDVSTYMSWALSLSEHPFAAFYSTVGFADYPPGYFYILAAVGKFWHVFFSNDRGQFAVLRVLVKLPAIVADLGIGVLLFAIVRRFAGAAYALGAAAFYLLNPATIFISAAWGQVDSVAGGLALLAIYALLRSGDESAQSRAHLMWIAGAWLAFGYSLLIKPQAAVLLPLMVAFAFVDPQRRRERVAATAAGAVAALLLALLLTEPFHPGNPIAALVWLLERYAYGSNVYAYNTVNAFNLWALRGTLWVPDNQYILLLPQYLWGLLLVLAALALIVWRYVQDRTDRSLVEGCAIATLAFFVLATRMHERYLFNGLLFSIACIPFARRYIWGAFALSAALLANLLYSLEYLHVVTGSVPGANAQNLWGLGTTAFSSLVVLTFFWLGYVYLGGGEVAAPASAPPRPAVEREAAVATGTRHWFDPGEGLAIMRAPLD